MKKLLLTLLLTSNFVFALSIYDDLDEGDFADLISEAKNAANVKNYDLARQKLIEAEDLGVQVEQLKQVGQSISLQIRQEKFDKAMHRIKKSLADNKFDLARHQLETLKKMSFNTNQVAQMSDKISSNENRYKQILKGKKRVKTST